MSAPKSQVRLKLDELCADGQWHEIHQLVEVLTPMVPASAAVRARRHARDAHRTHGPRRGISVEREVAIGARIKVKAVIGNAAMTRAYEQSGDLIRLNPNKGE